MRQIKHNLLENCSSFIKYVSLIKFYGTGFWVNIRWKAKICILIGRFYGKTETIQLHNISYPFWQNTKLRNSKIYAPSKQHLPEIMIQSSSLCYGKVLIMTSKWEKEVVSYVDIFLSKEAISLVDLALWALQNDKHLLPMFCRQRRCVL